MNKKIKIGMAGCGWIAEKAHIPAFNKVDGVSVTAVYDTNIKKAEELAQKFDIPNVSDKYEELLESEVDAIIILTPNYTHGQYALKALEAKKHVLCEKPITIYTDEMLKIMEAASENEMVFMPGFVNRFRPDIEKLYQLFAKEDIGELQNVKVGWLRKAGIPRPGTWFTNKKYSGGGVLIDLGSHIIDIGLMFLKGKEGEKFDLQTCYNLNENRENFAQWFKANQKEEMKIDVENTAKGKATFDGITLDIMLSWSAPIDGDCTYFKLIGDKGSIELQTLFGYSNDKLWQEDQIILRKSSSDEQIINVSTTRNKSEIAFERLAQYFTDYINGEESKFLNIEDGFKTVNTIDKLYKSENKMESITLPNIEGGLVE